MAKHLVDLDEDALAAAREQLGTFTIKDTVNRALELVASVRRAQIEDAIEVLSQIEAGAREEAWR